MKFWALGCSVILIPFYICVAVAVLTPKVSEEYQAYYIDRRTNLTVAEQIRLKQQLRLRYGTP